MINGTAATVDRLNVGGSTIFGRATDERKNIVEDTPGVIRDRIYEKAEWLTREFRVIDTGGIQPANQGLQTEINVQVEIVIDEVDYIVSTASGEDGPTHDDEYVAKLPRKTKEPIIPTVSKVDDFAQNDTVYEFCSLRLGDPLAVSGAHGIGTGDILSAVIHALPEKEKDEYDGMTKFYVIGRPGVGKSSPVSTILDQERVIVSNIEGTTRDAIDTPFKRGGREYVVIDTAGIRERGKVYEDTEKYPVLRTMNAAERNDVVLVIIDGEKGIRDQDKRTAGYAHEAGKSVVIAYSKQDAVEKDEQTVYAIKREIRVQFLYLPYAPVLLASVLKKQRIHTILPVIGEVRDYSVLRIQTNVLNEVTMDMQPMTPPPTYKEQHLKICYASQVSVALSIFVLFVSDPGLLRFNHK